MCLVAGRELYLPFFIPLAGFLFPNTTFSNKRHNTENAVLKFMYCTFPFSRNTNLRFRFIRVSILFHFISFLSSSFGESNSEACDKGVIIFQLQSLKRVVCGKYSSFFLAVVCFFFLFIPLKCLVCGTFKDKNISGISRQKRNKNQNVSTDVVP